MKKYVKHFEMFPFEIEEPAEGITKQFVLREPDGAVRDDYLNKLSQRVKVEADGTTRRVSDFKDFQSELIQACMFHAKIGPNDEILSVGSQVDLKYVNGLPGRIVAELYEEARQIARVKKAEAEAEAKNDFSEETSSGG